MKLFHTLYTAVVKKAPPSRRLFVYPSLHPSTNFKTQTIGFGASNDEEVARHSPAEGGIQAGRTVRPDRVEEKCIQDTAAAGEAGRILVAGEVDHSPVVEVDRSLADHRILVVVDSHPGAARTVVLGHNRRHSLLLEGEEPAIFRLWYRMKRRLLQA